MDNQVLIERIKAIIDPVLVRANIELVDLGFLQTSGQIIIKLLVDKISGGINLDECARLSREVRWALDQENIIVSGYALEVSSPGLDRVLKSKKDFMRCLHKQVVFFLNDLVNGKCQWQGLIFKVDEAVVFIQAQGEVLEIPLIKINKAQLVI